MARNQDHCDLPTFDNTFLQLESSRFVAWIRTSCLFKPIGPLCNVWLLPALQRFASRVGGIGLPLNLTVMRQTDTFNRHRCWNQNSVSN